MNDPWLNLVDSLNGHQRATPEQWPSRRVHRMLDDVSPSAAAHVQLAPPWRRDPSTATPHDGARRFGRNS